MRIGRRERPPVELAAGESALAWAVVDGGGWVVGTRDALYVPAGRVPWEQVEAADWDDELERLRVTEVGTFGEPRPQHLLTLATKGADTHRLLQLVRERVTASVLLSRHVPVVGHKGVRVIARRAPAGRSPVLWFYEYDAGIDPDDPVVRAAAETALDAARSDVGEP
jgi:hypothetical protein